MTFIVATGKSGSLVRGIINRVSLEKWNRNADQRLGSFDHLSQVCFRLKVLTPSLILLLVEGLQTSEYRCTSHIPAKGAIMICFEGC